MGVFAERQISTRVIAGGLLVTTISIQAVRFISAARSAAIRRAPQRPAGGRAEGRRRGELQRCPLRPDATGVTDAHCWDQLRKMNFTARGRRDRCPGGRVTLIANLDCVDRSDARSGGSRQLQVPD